MNIEYKKFIEGKRYKEYTYLTIEDIQNSYTQFDIIFTMNRFIRKNVRKFSKDEYDTIQGLLKLKDKTSLIIAYYIIYHKEE